MALDVLAAAEDEAELRFLVPPMDPFTYSPSHLCILNIYCNMECHCIVILLNRTCTVTI